MQHGRNGLIAASARTATYGCFHRPADVAGIIAALAAAEAPPVFVCGGTDLCAQLNEGLSAFDLVALDRVAELRRVTRDGDTLRIGAATTHEEGAADPLLRRLLPGFALAWGRIANERVRGWATIGGNLMALRPRYEVSVMLTAMDADLVFLGADGVEFTRKPLDLWRHGRPDRALLRHVAVPLRERAVFSYDRSLRPTMTLAVYRDASSVRAAVATEMLAPVALTVPAGLSAVAAASAAFEGLPPAFADAASSHWYLSRAGTVLLRRALEAGDVHG